MLGYILLNIPFDYKRVVGSGCGTKRLASFISDSILIPSNCAGMTRKLVLTHDRSPSFTKGISGQLKTIFGLENQ